MRANVTIRDSEVIEKAKKKLLRGWSFGFIAHQEHEEYADSFKRKFIDDLELFEVSIIDDTLLPCYIGTSIEERAEKQVKREFRGEKERFIKTIESSIVKDKKEEIDYSNFEQRIKKMKGEN